MPMAMLANQVTAWVIQGLQSDRRTGFVVMTRAQMTAGIAAGRMQDPMVGAYKLKWISPLYIAGLGDSLPPPPEPRPEPESEPAPEPAPEPTPEPTQPTSVTQRRRGA
jgi:hypothetical protein